MLEPNISTAHPRVPPDHPHQRLMIPIEILHLICKLNYRNYQPHKKNLTFTKRRHPNTMPKSSFLFVLLRVTLMGCPGTTLLLLAVGEIEIVPGGLFIICCPIELKLCVCWWFIAAGGNATLRFTTNLTVFPLSRKTCTAVAYSTFSKLTPFTVIILSFTLQKEMRINSILLNVCTYCNLSSAGPPFRTSLTAIDGSPLAKWGLSRPPDTAIPKP